MTVLLLGTAADRCLVAVLKEFARRGFEDFDFIDVVALQNAGSVRSVRSGSEFDLQFELRGVETFLSSYLRVLCRWQDWSEGAPDEEQAETASAIYRTAGSLLGRAGWPAMMNRPFLHPGLMSKAMQLACLVSTEWQALPCLATNDVDAAVAFCSDMGGRVIVKGCSGQKTWARLTDAGELRARAGDLRAAPVLLQKWCRGSDVRVHVVGERCFAEETLTREIDCRRDRFARRRPASLAQPVLDECIRLTRALGLFASGIDFKLGDDGVLNFLEINSLPDYLGFDLRAGGAITGAVCDWLTESS